jgi:hypothetical protein
MQAELAALDHGRWSFALSCTRVALRRPATTAGLVRAGGLAVVAAEVLVLLEQGRTDTTLIVVWAAMLTIYTIALLRVTARRSTIATSTLVSGAGLGVLAALAWVAAAALEPSVPSSSGPAVLAIAAAAVCATWACRGGQGQIAGLCAAAGCALLIAVMIDGPLPLFPGWVSTSAPPVYPPETAARLVDSIGVWVLGCLLATALTLAIRSARETMPSWPPTPSTRARSRAPSS